MILLLFIPLLSGSGLSDYELTLFEDMTSSSSERSFSFAEPPLSPRGRVIESFLPETLATMDKRLADRLVRRISKDEELDEFSPQLKPDNTVEFAPFLGKIELDKLVVSSYRTLLFTVKNNPSFAVKYVHDCSGGLVPIVPHPLLTESWYGSRAASRDIAPGVYFVSPPVRLPANQHHSIKSWFDMTPLQHMDCYFSDATVRFALVERIQPAKGRSLQGLYREGRLGGIRQAAEIAVALIPVLEQLHRLDMVHGDIGIDRVAIISEDDFLKYQLINFGSASFTDVNGSATTPQARSPDRDYLKSHWEFAGGQNYRYTQRDDLVRLLQVIATIMDPVNYLPTQLNMVHVGNMTLLMAWKQFGSFFVPLHAVPLNDPVQSLPISDLRKLMIRFKLVEIEGIVRGSSTRIEPATYGLLVEKFKAILVLMNQTHSDNVIPEIVGFNTSQTPISVATTTAAPPSPSGKGGKRKRDF
jgi:hypothetical protein